jgi:ribonuclease P protein component
MNCLAVRKAKNHRMAVSISRKHDKRAVQRNRYRRGLYDGLLPLLKTIRIKYCQCVFTLKKGLKIPEKRIPDTWVADALSIFEK